MRNSASTRPRCRCATMARSCPATGVGGAGVHWNGFAWRYYPSPTSNASRHLTKRYGAKKIARLAACRTGASPMTKSSIATTALNISAACRARPAWSRAQIQPGGNPFEGNRSREYPNPPLKMPYSSTLFGEAARNMGLHPFPAPSANLSRAYINPLGIAMGECTYCGFCERFGCGNYSKASPQTTILPVLDEEAELRSAAPSARC